MKIDPKIFKAYDVRGIYPGEITTEIAYAIGRAFGMFVVKDLKAALPAKIAAYAANEFVKSKLGARGKTSALENITAEYVVQDLSYLNFGKIKKFKIAADPANAMGSLYLDELFKHIACDPIRINWELNGNMPVHEANPLKVETLQQLQEVARNGKADFGIATDGDGDRLAFLDERGEVIPP